MSYLLYFIVAVFSGREVAIRVVARYFPDFNECDLCGHDWENVETKLAADISRQIFQETGSTYWIHDRAVFHSVCLRCGQQKDGISEFRQELIERARERDERVMKAREIMELAKQKDQKGR